VRPLHLAVLVLVATALGSCAHELPLQGGAPSVAPRRRAVIPPSEPAEYLVADPHPKGGTIVVPLAHGALGVVVDRARIVLGRGEPASAPERPEGPFTKAQAIPPRLGGGYLFATEYALYRAATFDGPLAPLARFSDGVQVLSFAPSYLLVRTRNAERWALALPSGERRPLEPLGVADIEALDDGRVIAFDDRGSVFTSANGGANWLDVTIQLRSAPSKVAIVDGELWLLEASGGALRLEADGRLSFFDRAPASNATELRPRDPRWRGEEAPLRAAFLHGAAVDDRTALVLAAGDLVRIDLRTGEVLSVVSGTLPPEAQCDAVPTSHDVLFACVTRGRYGAAGTAFVVSRTLGKAPMVEHTFGVEGSFFASDDGGLAFGGSCDAGVTSPPGALACVREPDGSWTEHDLSSVSGSTTAGLVRWVPRADGHVVALVSRPSPAVVDTRSGTVTRLAEDVVTRIGAAAFQGAKRFGSRTDAGVVDASWTLTAKGELRGWHPGGGGVEISEVGSIKLSPYTFEVLGAGARALGRARDGRLYQSMDHGVTWTEIAAPPGNGFAVEPRGCSSAGCDLGGFYRVGWAVLPPRAVPPVAFAGSVPEVRRASPVELSCSPAGPAASKLAPRTSLSPDDLGLGASRVPAAGADRDDIGFLREPIVRQIIHPLHDSEVGDSDIESLRAMLSGYQTTRDGDLIEVLGPNKAAAALRRKLSFIPGFEPTAPVRKTSLAMSEVISAGRAAGLSTEEILSEDMTESGVVILMTPAEADAPSEIALHNARGLLAWTGRRARPRLLVRPSEDEAVVISGVALSADEAAFLELESSGRGRAFKITGGAATDLFEIGPAATDPWFYPANPDALAVGPKGELAIVRVASGSEPPSTLDPALLLVPGAPAVALAPWSTLTFADEEACRAEPGGYRVTLQAIAPWVRLSTPELRTEDGGMLARVRWSERRVCLEGIELRLPPVTVRAPGEPVPVATWLISRGRSFARVGIGEGVEWRQPLTCELRP
jgi:hypothetical protein